MNKYGLEARDNWIAARIDELMDDAEWLKSTNSLYEIIKESIVEGKSRWVISVATQVAEREHAAIMADLEDEVINQHRGHHEF